MSGTVAPLNGLRPDIALQVGQGVQQQQNPLATFGQFAGIQNALTQNRALEAGIKQTEQGTAGMAQQQALQRAGMVGQLAGSLLMEHPGGIPAGALADATAALLGAGLIKREEVGPMLLNVPMGADPDSTAQRTAWVRQVHAQALAIPEQITRTRGTLPQFVNTGGENVPFVADERSVRRVPGSVPNTMPPTSAADLVQVPVMGPDGKPTNATETITRAEAARRGGLSGTVAPGVFGDGRVPATLRNPKAPTPTAPVASPPPTAPPQASPAHPATTGSLGTTMAPAQATAANTTAGKSADAFSQIAEVAAGVPDRRSGLQTMLGDADKFATGPGQERIKLGQTVLQRFAPTLAAALGITEESIAANESFDKIAARIASQQGAGSDARLSVAQNANPSSKLSPGGVRLILNQLIGNEDYLEARNKLATAWPDKTDRPGFEANVGANLDPRVFQYNRMTGDQKREFWGTIRDKAAFKRAYDWASSKGLFGTP